MAALAHFLDRAPTGRTVRAALNRGDRCTDRRHRRGGLHLAAHVLERRQDHAQALAGSRIRANGTNQPAENMLRVDVRCHRAGDGGSRDEPARNERHEHEQKRRRDGRNQEGQADRDACRHRVLLALMGQPRADKGSDDQVKQPGPGNRLDALPEAAEIARHRRAGHLFHAISGPLLHLGAIVGHDGITGRLAQARCKLNSPHH